MSAICKNSAPRVNKAAILSRRLSRLASSFGNDQRGTVAMLFGLMAIALMTLVGGAVDVGRWLHVYSQTKAAVDSAVLAGARSLQVTGGDTAMALRIARNFYLANVKSRAPLKNDNIDFVLNASGKSVKATGTAYLDTPFLSLVRIPRLPLWKDGGAELSEAVAGVTGANAGNIEISMMLDVTGSMAGEKLHGPEGRRKRSPQHHAARWRRECPRCRWRRSPNPFVPAIRI